MSRQALTDGTRRWFSPAKAERFDEGDWWDGSNHVSSATGSQWDHEELYRTAAGRWILHWWSQWQGSQDRWEEVSDEFAAGWLVKCEHEPHQACAEAYAELEIV